MVRKTIKEEYDNIAKLSGYFGNVVLTDWQAAVLHARASPCRAHIMVRKPYWNPTTLEVAGTHAWAWTSML